jgi:ferredoxin
LIFGGTGTKFAILMADPRDKFQSNAPGRYFVDRTCVHCELCHELAPEHFAQTPHEGFVCRQPVTGDEERTCRHALDSCPVGAIGSNG